MEFINARDVLPMLIDDSGKSMQSVSLAIGKSSTYVKSTIFKGSISHVDTVADVADACGYDLILRRRFDGKETGIAPSCGAKTPEQLEIEREQREYDELLKRQKEEREAFKKRKK